MSYPKKAITHRLIQTPVYMIAVVSLTWLAASMPASTAVAAQPPDATAQSLEGRIGNVSDETFRFRLRRSRGRTWTRQYVLKPGEHYVVRRPEDGGRDDLDGISVKPGQIGEGHLIVQFSEYGGSMRQRIKAVDLNEDLMPFWFYVKDANGNGRLVQRASAELARKNQQELQQEEPLTPGQLEEFKLRLRANYALYLP